MRCWNGWTLFPPSMSPTAQSPSEPQCLSSTHFAAALRSLRTPGRTRSVDDIALANPRGFCAGVDRAIAIVEQALVQFGPPIYVRHEVVHNKFVVEDLKSKGAIFVDALDEVPSGSTVVFSAHGVSRAVRAEAESRGFRIFDATCPLVTKVHVEVARMRQTGS